MKQLSFYLFGILIFVSIGWFANTAFHLPGGVAKKIIKYYPLEKYSIENLSKTEFKPSEIKVDGNLFEFNVDEKKATGQINIPEGKGPFPIIVMFRGYIDQKIYKTGDGTRHAAEVFVKNGFITIAPDFLGYGGSDPESSDIFESRFQTYITAVETLKSVNTIKEWDGKNVFIWGHSNGGQVALTTLEITGVNYPTVLWAPNSAKFPYSILYYLDEADDQGKLIISKLAEFMGDYDVTKYSFTNYLDKIKAPIQIHQGTSDKAVPVDWNINLTKKLNRASVSAELIKHPGASHDMVPGWNEAVLESLQFFQRHLTK